MADLAFEISEVKTGASCFVWFGCSYMAPRDEPALRQGTLLEGEPEYAFAVALYTHFDAGTVPLCPEGCLRTNFIASVLHTYPDRVSKKFNKLFPGRPVPKFARRGELDAAAGAALADLEGKFRAWCLDAMGIHLPEPPLTGAMTDAQRKTAAARYGRAASTINARMKAQREEERAAGAFRAPAQPLTRKAAAVADDGWVPAAKELVEAFCGQYGRWYTAKVVKVDAAAGKATVHYCNWKKAYDSALAFRLLRRDDGTLDATKDKDGSDVSRVTGEVTPRGPAKTAKRAKAAAFAAGALRKPKATAKPETPKKPKTGAKKPRESGKASDEPAPKKRGPGRPPKDDKARKRPKPPVAAEKKSAARTAAEAKPAPRSRPAASGKPAKGAVREKPLKKPKRADLLAKRKNASSVKRDAEASVEPAKAPRPRGRPPAASKGDSGGAPRKREAPPPDAPAAKKSRGATKKVGGEKDAEADEALADAGLCGGLTWEVSNVDPKYPAGERRLKGIECIPNAMIRAARVLSLTNEELERVGDAGASGAAELRRVATGGADVLAAAPVRVGEELLFPHQMIVDVRTRIFALPAIDA